MSSEFQLQADRFRLYQNEMLFYYQLKPHFAELFKLYTIVLVQFPEFCKDLVSLFCNFFNTEISLKYFEVLRNTCRFPFSFRRNPWIREITNNRIVLQISRKSFRKVAYTGRHFLKCCQEVIKISMSVSCLVINQRLMPS